MAGVLAGLIVGIVFGVLFCRMWQSLTEPHRDDLDHTANVKREVSE